MINKLLFFAVMLTIVACFEDNINQSRVEEVKVVLTSEKGKSIAEEMLDFNRFVAQLSNASADEITSKLQKQAKFYFPDSTVFNNHYLFGHEIPYRDSFRLLLYEYSTEDASKNHMYLGSFSLSGKVLDILKTETLTAHDGNISINLVDGEYLEVEYADFGLKHSFYESNRYCNKLPDSLKITPENPVTKYKKYTRQNDFEQHIFYKYYQIDSVGLFVQLNNTTFDFPDRKYPLVSSKILSFEELNQYSNKQLAYMKQEIFAVHGLVFTSKKWKRAFRKQEWYAPKFINVDYLLSNIEQINIAKIDQAMITY